MLERMLLQAQTESVRGLRQTAGHLQANQSHSVDAVDAADKDEDEDLRCCGFTVLACLSDVDSCLK